jgi:hypothetical protein
MNKAKCKEEGLSHATNIRNTMLSDAAENRLNKKQLKRKSINKNPRCQANPNET